MNYAINLNVSENSPGREANYLNQIGSRIYRIKFANLKKSSVNLETLDHILSFTHLKARVGFETFGGNARQRVILQHWA